MANELGLDAEELLEKIFFHMNRILDEKDFSSTIQILTDLGRTLVNSDRASFWFWDKKKKQYWTIVALDNNKITIPEGTGLVGAAISNNETIIINDPYNDSRFNADVDKETGYVTKSILCMPVSNAKGEVIGAYQAINKLGKDDYTSIFTYVDKMHLALAAGYCGKTLESYILSNEMMIDVTTGLRNVNGFYEYYNKRILPFSINNTVSIIMADMDHFHLINEKYGRSCGDEILHLVADTIQYCINIDDEAFRWSEDRFVILLSKKNREEAWSFADTLRQRIENLDYSYNGEPVPFTMSLGINELVYEKPSDDNIQAAANNLCTAKMTGRNKVV